MTTPREVSALGLIAPGGPDAPLSSWRQVIAHIPAAPIFAFAGWLCLWAGIALRYGSWLLIAGVGLGMLLAGLGVMVKDAVAGWMLAYYGAAHGKDDR